MSIAMAPAGDMVWPANPAGADLSARQKAAIIVRLALAAGVNMNLKQLPDALQSDLVREMADLKYVDQGTIEGVVNEFLAKFEAAGMSFPGVLSETLDLLHESISPEIANRMRRQAGLSLHKDPWGRIGEMESDALVPVLSAESMEVAAVVLSKLKVSKAAEILGKMEGDKARRTAYAISLTGSIPPRIVDRIGHTLAEQLDTKPDIAFTDGPVERVGAILNYSPSITRDDVLDGLEQEDAGFAREVRKAIFTFANIPDRIDERDVPKILRVIEQADLITALAGAVGPAEKTRDYLLENMSKRMAEQLREEIAELGEVKTADADAAQTRAVIAIRELEATGEISLVANDQDE